ncbi:MAG: DUF4258 domain-containing protein [Chloroflexi bacterium]|nr:DUF4258 domain-containing protein [Chloroflexota bacterium]
MPRRVLLHIQDAVSRGEYDVTAHAVDEIAEDGLNIFDVEAAVMNGEITKTETDDPRGTRYTIVGTAADGQTLVGLAGRFKETGIFLIVTAYEVTD